VSFVHEVRERQQYIPEGSGCEGGAAAPGGGGDTKVRVMKQGLDQGVSSSEGAWLIFLV